MDIDTIKISLNKLRKKIDLYTPHAKKVLSVCNTIDNSWSGSEFVSHANYFYKDYKNPPTESRFSIEWGLLRPLPDGWGEKSDDEVIQKIESSSGIFIEDLDEFINSIVSDFDSLRKESILAFSEVSREAALEVEKFNMNTYIDIFNQYWKRSRQTRDSEAAYAGIKAPPHKLYEAKATFLISADKQIEEFLFLINKVIAQNKSTGLKLEALGKNTKNYIDQKTLLRLRKIQNSEFDLTKLISLCNELDDNYRLDNYYSCLMILRAILDHIPPIFNKTNFQDVSTQYGTRSFKDTMKPLNVTAKKIADDYLHSQISKKVLLTTQKQVDFGANLDFLLNEIASILESKD
jgi:hypothetical protein